MNVPCVGIKFHGADGWYSFVKSASEYRESEMRCQKVINVPCVGCLSFFFSSVVYVPVLIGHTLLLASVCFLIFNRKLTPTFCVYDGCGFRSRLCPTWVDEVNKTKLHFRVSPAAGINREHDKWLD